MHQGRRSIRYRFVSSGDRNIKTVYQQPPFTALSAQRRNGLIICKTYHAEFAGPGAAVGRPCDFDCQEAIAIGNKWELVPMTAEEDKQMAYRRRIQWMYWLKKIAERPKAAERAEALLSSFDAFFAPQAIAALPVDALAMLVGVFPHTMARIHEQHYSEMGIAIPAPGQSSEFWSYVQFQHQAPPERTALKVVQRKAAPHFFKSSQAPLMAF